MRPQDSSPAAVRPERGRVAGTIVGNLDCETEWACEDPAVGGRRARRGLRAEVEQVISSFATLLRVFGCEGDQLWTPRAVDPSRLPEVPGLPPCDLVSGPLTKLRPSRPLVAWGETRSIRTLRDRASVAAGASGASGAAGAADASRAAPACAPWLAFHAAPEVAASVNHRGFCLDARAKLDCVLPGACRLGSLADLEAHLGSDAALSGLDGRWVLKQPHSAAGQGRLFGQGRLSDRSGAGGSATPQAVARALESQGELIFEPWMDRLVDFATWGWVGADDVHLIGTGQLLVDARGGFRGVEVSGAGLVSGAGPVSGSGSVSAVAPSGSSEEQRLDVESRVTALARFLEAAGYRGFFAVDGWTYRDADGRPQIQPLGEVNARLSFGAVAEALRRRLRDALGLTAESVVRLLLRPDSEPIPAPGPALRVVPLLLPGEPAAALDQDARKFQVPGTAWLELEAGG